MFAALKIHCSSDTKNILERIGGYGFSERGFVSMKGKGDVQTYWLVSQEPSLMRTEKRPVREEDGVSLLPVTTLTQFRKKSSSVDGLLDKELVAKLAKHQVSSEDATVRFHTSNRPNIAINKRAYVRTPSTVNSSRPRDNQSNVSTLKNKDSLPGKMIDIVCHDPPKKTRSGKIVTLTKHRSSDHITNHYTETKKEITFANIGSYTTGGRQECSTFVTASGKRGSASDMESHSSASGYEVPLVYKASTADYSMCTCEFKESDTALDSV